MDDKKISSILRTYGSLPVSTNNLYKLLSMNEIVLLYPGGGREVI